MKMEAPVTQITLGIYTTTLSILADNEKIDDSDLIIGFYHGSDIGDNIDDITKILINDIVTPAELGATEEEDHGEIYFILDNRLKEKASEEGEYFVTLATLLDYMNRHPSCEDRNIIVAILDGEDDNDIEVHALSVSGGVGLMKAVNEKNPDDNFTIAHMCMIDTLKMEKSKYTS